MKKIIDLGKIGITLAGEYNDKTIYEKLTIVLYKGKSYISTKTVQGISPTQDIRSWQLVAEAKDAYHMLVDAEKTTLTEEEFLEQLVDATKGRYIVQGNIINAADEEDLTIEHSDLLGIDTLKLANRDNTNGMGYVILRKNKSFAEQVTQINTIYEIRYNFDLNGEEITIPEGCILDFQGGSLNNCTIIGNDTKINANETQLFKHIKIKGSWLCWDIYSKWFDFISEEGFDNKENIKNISNLLSPSIYNNIYFKEDIWTSITENEILIDLVSNTTLKFAGVIKLLPSSVKKACVIGAKKSENITIDSVSLIGDVENHIDNGGEFYHGIKIGGCKNIRIKNCNITKFWGDGIDLIDASSDGVSYSIDNYNVVIDNCVCNYNRRQGLSIESGHNITISNSEFGYTGVIKYTAPGFGIDIEPWNDDTCHLSNITISKCFIHDSKYESLGLITHKQETHKDEIKNIRINDCVTDTITMYKIRGVSILNTKYDRIVEMENSENEYFINSGYLPCSGEYNKHPSIAPNGFLYYATDCEYLKGYFNSNWLFISGNKLNWDIHEGTGFEITKTIPTNYPERIDNIVYTGITLVPNVTYLFTITISNIREGYFILKIKDKDNNILKSLTIIHGQTTYADIFTAANKYQDVYLTTTCYDDIGGNVTIKVKKRG